MARTYAGILGYLAMAVMLMRGTIHGAGIEGSLQQGLIAMVIMATLGAIVGGIAERTVDESMRVSLERQLAEAEDGGAATTTEA